MLWSAADSVDYLLLQGSSFTTTRSIDGQTTFRTYKPTSASAQTSRIALHLLSVVALPGRTEHIGVAPSGEIYRLGPRVTASAPTTQTIDASVPKFSSIWQEMFGKDAFLDDMAPPPSEVVLPPTLAKPTDVFNGPSHTLPPVSLLFDAFMAQLLKPTLLEPIKTEGGKDSTIKYEEEVLVPEKKSGQSNTKKVTDEDVKELVGFFKDLLSDSPTSTSQAPAPRLVNGDQSPLKTSTSLSTPKTKAQPQANGKAKVNGTVVNGNGIPPTPQSEDSREKKNTKKRRAPKE